MGNVTNIQDFLKEKDFTEHVLPFFEAQGITYDYQLEEEECLFTLPYKEDFLYAFLRYCPRNEHTAKPSIFDRFFNIKSNPRISKGEWVVEKLYTINRSYHEELVAYKSQHPPHTPLIPLILKDLQK